MGKVAYTDEKNELREGVPEDVARAKESFTGRFLGRMLQQQRGRRAAGEKSA